MKSKIILLDLDGPLADLETGFLRAWRAKFPHEFFIPTEKRTTFFAYEQYPQELRPNIEEIWEMRGLFLDLPVVDGAVEAVKGIVDSGHTVFICTSAIYRNPTGLDDKRVWVRNHLGDALARTMIFTKDKTLVHGDYLIDDRPAITGLIKPSWEHIVFDQPFNRDTTHTKRMNIDWSNWKELLG